MSKDAKNKWEIIEAGVIVLLFVIVILVVGAALVTSVLPVGRWLAIAVTAVAFLIALGKGLSGRLDGILIDSRYKMSLSRFQMTMWTVLVFSAYLTIALPRSLPGGLPDIQTAEQVDACIKYLEDQDSEEAKDKAAEIKILKEQDLKELKQKAADLKALEDQDSKEAEEIRAETKALKDQYSDETKKKAQEQCTPGQPLNITFPPELVAALGISTASLAGSSLIKSVKGRSPVKSERVTEAEKAKQKADKELQAAVKKLKAAPQAVANAKKTGDEAKARGAEIDRDTALTEWKAAKEASETANENLKEIKKAQSEGSSLAKNEKVEQATWGDMFRSEVVGKEKAVDLAKVQMFFFTIVVVFAYATAIYGLLAKEAALTNPLGVDFPTFSSSLNALLGLSHAGYLTVKATGEA